MIAVHRIRVLVLLLALVGSGLVAGTAAANASRAHRSSSRAHLSGPHRASVGHRLTMHARLRPARQFRPVVLSQRVGHAWVRVARSQEDARGRVSFELGVSRRGAHAFRATAGPWHGDRGAGSNVVVVRVVRDRTSISPRFHRVPGAAVSAGSYDPRTGNLTFGRRVPAAVRALRAGDVFALPPEQGIASGALVRVRAVHRSRRRTVVVTSPATLPEVVQNTGGNGGSIALSPTGPVQVTGLPKGVTVSVTRPGARDARLGVHDLNGSTATFGFDKSLKFTDQTWSDDENGGRDPHNEAELHLTGTVQVTPKAEVGLDMDWFHVASYQLGAGFGLNAAVDGKFSVQHDVVDAGPGFDLDLGFARISMTESGVIGVVPVWVTVTGELHLVVDAKGQVSARYTASGPALVGIRGDKDHDGPSFYSETPTTDAAATEATVSGELDAKLLGALDIDLYSAAGPFVEAGYEGVGKVSLSTDGTASCELYHRPVLEFGIRTSDAIKRLTGFTAAPVDHEVDFEKHYVYQCPHSDDSGSGGDGGTGGSGGGTGGGSGGGSSLPAPRITTAVLPDGYVDDAYGSFLATAAGDAGAWSVSAGSLPAGVALDPATGDLSGTPTGPDGTASFTVTYTRTSDRASASKAETLTIHPRARWTSMDAQGCGVTDGGAAVCNKAKVSWYSGDGSSTNWPRRLTAPGAWTSFSGTCGVHTDGTAACARVEYWQGAGPDRSSPSLEMFDLPGQWSSVISRGGEACGIHYDSTGECWKEQDYLSPDEGYVPTTAPGLWRTLVPEYGGWCGIHTDGTLECGSESDSYTVPGTWRAISDDGGSCAIRTDQTGWCWTVDDQYQPTLVQQPGLWATIVGGPYQGCGLHADGTATCWKTNDSTGDVEPWMQLPDTTWSSIDGGGLGTYCGVTTGGQGWCWGYDGSGAVGDGQREYAAPDTPPYRLPGVWSSLASDGESTCGIQTDRSGWCWGYANPSDGTQHFSPTRVASSGTPFFVQPPPVE